DLTEGEILWCLTVPAVESQASRRLMREAAVRAGLIGPEPSQRGRLLLALEPEAAALECLHNERELELTGLVPGTRFMVIDAGGGTTDLTVHQVGGHGELDEVVQAN